MGDMTGALVGIIVVGIIFGALSMLGMVLIVPEIWEWLKPIIHEFTK